MKRLRGLIGLLVASGVCSALWVSAAAAQEPVEIIVDEDVRVTDAVDVVPPAVLEIPEAVTVVDVAAPNPLPLDTSAVTNTDDDGPGSLRQAILDANADPEIHAIAFAIPGPGPHVIQPISALPVVTSPVFIDGYTQPGAVPNTNPPELGSNAVLRIVLSGAALDDASSGLVIDGGGTTVRGLVINGFGDGDLPTAGAGNDAIQIRFQGGNRIQGNFIGTDPTGTVAVPNDVGVVISASQLNVIGTDGDDFYDPAHRNVISGSLLAGVLIQRGPVTGQPHENVIAGNLIGTDASGTAALGNRRGVILTNGPQRTRIGTNANGTSDAGERNVISGSAAEGVSISDTVGAGTADNVVAGNFIGTDVSGEAALGNGREAVVLSQSAGNLVGGDLPGAGNRIAFNGLPGGRPGIRVTAGAGNTVSGNAIFGNGGLGLDLDELGVTENDPGDTDGLQNHPSVLSVARDESSVKVTGALDSAPDGDYRIELFANAECDPSGYGEGETFLDATVVTTDAAGHADFSVTLPVVLEADEVLTATATAVTIGATSELSPCLQSDSDGDHIPDVLDEDDDNDGIFDAVDLQSLTDSKDFSDGGDTPTVGTIVDAGQQSLTITPVGGPGQGVRIAVAPGERDLPFRGLISNFNQAAQGALGLDPVGVALDGSGVLWVVDETAGPNAQGALFRVDATSGARVLVSDFGAAAQGPVAAGPLDVGVGSSGLLVVSRDGQLLEVDPMTGVRHLVSDFRDAGRGAAADDLRAVAIDRAGRILVAGPQAVFAVDASTGQRTLFADLSGVPALDIDDLAVESNRALLVVDDGGPDTRGALFRVVRSKDGSTIVTSVLSDFALSEQGPSGLDPTAIAVGPRGNIVVVDSGAGTGERGALFLVDPASGDRLRISDYGEAAEGPRGIDPVAVVADAAGALAVVDPSRGAEGRGALLRDAIPVPAQVYVEACGDGSTLWLDAGDEVVVSCGSIRIEVVRHTVSVVYAPVDGQQASTTLSEGSTLTFEPETFTFTAPSTNPEPTVVVVDGEELPVEPGETFDVDRVVIDVKPGDPTNAINLGSEGVIPVAILATSVAAGEAVDFHPGVLDPLSLSLAGAAARHKGKSGNVGALEDVDGDGDLDLVVQFETADLGLGPADTEVTLQGRSVDGDVVVVGRDAIVVVP